MEEIFVHMVLKFYRRCIYGKNVVYTLGFKGNNEFPGPRFIPVSKYTIRNVDRSMNG